MPISTARNERAKARAGGFTLVELMVVLFLIGIAAGAVVLALPGEAALVDRDAERFAARVAAARDAAVIEARPRGVWVSPSGYGFERRGPEGWEALDAKPFTTTDWSDGVRAATPGRSLTIRFDAVGLPREPADIAIVGARASRQVTVDAGGEVSVAR